jgi:hypothetical protein
MTEQEQKLADAEMDMMLKLADSRKAPARCSRSKREPFKFKFQGKIGFTYSIFSVS